MRKKTLLTQLNEQKWSFAFIAPVVLLFVIFVVGPLIASFYWDSATGATIILGSVVLFFLTHVYSLLIRRRA